MKKIAAALAAPALLVLVLAGCGSSSDSGSSSTSTTPRDKTCAAKDKLEGSLNDLTDPTLFTEGKSGITDALDQVQADADALGQDVDADLQPQVQDVRNALDRLKTDVGAIGDGKLSDSISQIGDDISAVGKAIGTLSDSLQARCSG
jgi:hypothetical protein